MYTASEKLGALLLSIYVGTIMIGFVDLIEKFFSAYKLLCNGKQSIKTNDNKHVIDPV
jgi:hypothetical protein